MCTTAVIYQYKICPQQETGKYESQYDHDFMSTIIQR